MTEDNQIVPEYNYSKTWVGFSFKWIMNTISFGTGLVKVGGVKRLLNLFRSSSNSTEILNIVIPTMVSPVVDTVLDGSALFLSKYQGETASNNFKKKIAKTVSKTVALVVDVAGLTMMFPVWSFRRGAHFLYAQMFNSLEKMLTYDRSNQRNFEVIAILDIIKNALVNMRIHYLEGKLGWAKKGETQKEIEDANKKADEEYKKADAALKAADGELTQAKNNHAVAQTQLAEAKSETNPLYQAMNQAYKAWKQLSKQWDVFINNIFSNLAYAKDIVRFDTKLKNGYHLESAGGYTVAGLIAEGFDISRDGLIKMLAAGWTVVLVKGTGKNAKHKRFSFKEGKLFREQCWGKWGYDKQGNWVKSDGVGDKYENSKKAYEDHVKNVEAQEAAAQETCNLAQNKLNTAQNGLDQARSNVERELNRLRAYLTRTISEINSYNWSLNKYNSSIDAGQMLLNLMGAVSFLYQLSHLSKVKRSIQPELLAVIAYALYKLYPYLLAQVNALPPIVPTIDIQPQPRITSDENNNSANMLPPNNQAEQLTQQVAQLTKQVNDLTQQATIDAQRETQRLQQIAQLQNEINIERAKVEQLLQQMELDRKNVAAAQQKFADFEKLVETTLKSYEGLPAKQSVVPTLNKINDKLAEIKSGNCTVKDGLTIIRQIAKRLPHDTKQQPHRIFKQAALLENEQTIANMEIYLCQQRDASRVSRPSSPTGVRQANLIAGHSSIYSQPHPISIVSSSSHTTTNTLELPQHSRQLSL